MSVTVVAQIKVGAIGMNTLPSITSDDFIAPVAEDIGMLDLWLTDGWFDQVGCRMDSDKRMSWMLLGKVGFTIRTTIPIGTLLTCGSSADNLLETQITCSTMLFGL
jgi:hypothetical protein